MPGGPPSPAAPSGPPAPGTGPVQGSPRPHRGGYGKPAPAGPPPDDEAQHTGAPAPSDVRQELADACERLSGELDRLTRISTGAQDQRQHHLLRWVADMLELNIRQLERGGVDATRVAPLAQLLTELRTERLPLSTTRLDELWHRTVRVISGFITQNPPTQPAKPRRAFWKRSG